MLSEVRPERASKDRRTHQKCNSGKPKSIQSIYRFRTAAEHRTSDNRM